MFGGEIVRLLHSVVFFLCVASVTSKMSAKFVQVVYHTYDYSMWLQDKQLVDIDHCRNRLRCCAIECKGCFSAAVF